MRILHCIYDDPKNPWCGGGGAIRAQKINEILAREHSITVVTGKYPGALNETSNKVCYRRVGWASSYLLSRLSYTLLVPWFIMRGKCDLIIHDVSFFSPSFANFFSPAPCVTIIHHIMEKHAFKLYSLIGLIPYLTEKLILTSAKRIITPSLRLKKILAQKTRATQIANIPNGVADDFFTLSPEEKPFILFLGRLDLYMKGLDLLIPAFAQQEDTGIRLLIAGGGKESDQKELRRLINHYNQGDRVELLGRVSESKKMEMLGSCLFFAMPSRFEGWGIAAVEANGAGKAVLATRIPGLDEAVNDGSTALLVEAENVDELAAAMKKLINDSALRASLGHAGRIHARRFSWEQIAKKQMLFYLETLHP